MTDTPDDTPDTPDDTPAHDEPTGQVTAGDGLAQPAHVGGPALGMAEAIRASGMSRSTLQRRLKDGEIPGAHRGPDGTWRIPVAGLVGAGFLAGTTPPDAPSLSGPVGESGPTSAGDAAEIARLRAEVERLRAERDIAHALATERAQGLEDLRSALAVLSRALPAAPESTPAPVSPNPSPEPAAVGEPRRRWWRR